MYKTEGYADKDTYLVKEHLWSHAIRYQGEMCFCWWVSETRQMQEKLRGWMKQELTEALSKGISAVRKELKRFGAGLENGELFLYFEQQLWRYSVEAGQLARCEWCTISAHTGLFLSESLERLEEVQVFRRETSKNSKPCIAQLANQLQTILMRALSEGRLEQGYFFCFAV